MSRIGIIISREFKERVQKKSFIIMTILTPILMIALGAAPTLMMLHNTGDAKQIVVVDDTDGAFVGHALKSGSLVSFQLLENMSRQEASTRYSDEDKAFGILWIGNDFVRNPDNVKLITNTSSSVMIEEEISGQLSDILKVARLREYDIENLEQILADADVKVSLATMKNNGNGDDENMEQMSSDIATTISLVFGMMLYMFIIIYGQQVLASVIEEKQSRVLDVMVTSCKPFEMMMGKILGIAAVAAVQVAIWCVLISFASQFLIPMIPMEEMENPAFASTISTTFGDILYILKLFALLLLYIIGGFLLYASLFAAAGSAVDANQDAQQFNTIIMLPIILGLIVMMSVFNDPNSSMALWFSIIPFTSPIVMMARIPFDIPFWQIAVSLSVLYASFILSTWIAARIYRIGIFMHGKKPSWKDLGSWLRTR